MFLFSHYVIFSVKRTSPSRSKTVTQDNTANAVLHSWDGVLIPLLPPNVAMIIVVKHFNVCFNRCTCHLQVFIPEFICKLLSGILSNGFFVSEWPFSPQSTCLIVPASASIFHTKTRSSLGNASPTLTISAGCCLCRHLII